MGPSEYLINRVYYTYKCVSLSPISQIYEIPVSRLPLLLHNPFEDSEVVRVLTKWRLQLVPLIWLFLQARKWVAFELKLDPDKAVNLFETTIRIVGGLLAAFHLSHGDKTMLYKAASLALRLLPAFDSPSGQFLAMNWRNWEMQWTRERIQSCNHHECYPEL